MPSVPFVSVCKFENLLLFSAAHSDTLILHYLNDTGGGSSFARTSSTGNADGITMGSGIVAAIVVVDAAVVAIVVVLSVSSSMIGTRS